MSETPRPGWSRFEFDAEQALRHARLDLDYIQHGGSGVLDRDLRNEPLKPMTIARRIVKTADLAGPTDLASQHPDVLSSWDAERAQRAAADACRTSRRSGGSSPDGSSGAVEPSGSAPGAARATGRFTGSPETARSRVVSRGPVMPAPTLAFDPGQPRRSPQRRGVCLVISAPSGAGKSTIANALRAAEPELTHSGSATTRAPRPGEVEGVHYSFRTLEQFAAMAEEGALLEWATVFGRGYGTPRAPVEACLAAGRDMVFDIDWQGHRQLRAALPGDVVGLFVLPASLGALRDRLAGRGQDDSGEIERRMQAARDECVHWPEFDHVLVNDRLDVAVAEARAVLAAARLASSRQASLAASILGDPP